MGEQQNPLEVLSIDQLRERTSAKWQAFGPDVLPLWVAEMDVPLAEPVAQALRRVVELGDTGYPQPQAYAEAFASFAGRRWGWQPQLSQIRAVPDVMRGVVEAIKIVGELTDTVIVSSPVYPPFYMYPVSAGRRVVEAPLGADGRLDFEMLEESFNLRTIGGQATYLLANPHNPTGTVHTRAELEQLAELAKQYGIRVVADEIHAPLVHAGAEFTPYVSVDPRGYSVVSASKAFNLAGLKAGLLVAGEDAADELDQLPPEVAHGPSHVGVLTHTAALAEGDAWLDALLAGLESNRRLLGQLLEEHLPQVGFTAPEATYLAWLDFSAYGFDDDAPTPGVETPIHGPARLLLEKAQVALTAGHPFGEGGQRRARLNFATSEAILTEAVQRMGAALER
ncbi:aminotransferase class I/II-fold pyridoxal phosphate-dependent enzyme [Nesterenkonia sp.]|uniref:MalY/PatB family protein n=1 Tax=Nesterenkonia sp. TaxID=704201 RepID=UPI00262F855F|nr:aminotransferase class I/II-fold pyridoxal phosphate-dependent enzyme [Nesterenkonia sp.]